MTASLRSTSPTPTSITGAMATALVGTLVVGVPGLWMLTADRLARTEPQS